MLQKVEQTLPQIDRGIPFQQKLGFAGAKPKWKPFLTKLGVGDSFLIDKKQTGIIYRTVRILRRDLGWDFKSSAVDGDKEQVRFWRVK